MRHVCFGGHYLCKNYGCVRVNEREACLSFVNFTSAHELGSLMLAACSLLPRTTSVTSFLRYSESAHELGSLMLTACVRMQSCFPDNPLCALS